MPSLPVTLLTGVTPTSLLQMRGTVFISRIGTMTFRLRRCFVPD